VQVHKYKGKNKTGYTQLKSVAFCPMIVHRIPKQKNSPKAVPFVKLTS